MKKSHFIIGFLALFGILCASVALGSTLQGFQGGTGYATTTASNVGNFLQVASTSPFLTYTYGTTTFSGTFTTTTIAVGSTTLSSTAYTFSTSTTGNDWVLTTNGTGGVNFNFPTSVYSLNSINHVTGTIPVADGNGNYFFIAPGTNGFLLVSSSSAPRGLQWQSLAQAGVQSTLTFPLTFASTTHVTILGGTGIQAVTSNGTTTLNSTGVTGLVAGTDITISAPTGSVTVSNTFASSTWLKVANNLSDGVSSTMRTNLGVKAGTGLTFDATNGFVNNGVLSVTSGTGISVSSATGTVTITNTLPNNNATTTVGGLTGNILLTSSSSASIATTTTAINFSARHYPIQWIIENPTASENDAIFIMPSNSTMDGCDAVNKSVADTVTWGLGYAATRNTATSSLTQMISGTTVATTATTTPVSITLNGVASTSPSATNPIIFYTTAASSSQFTLTCWYSEK